MIYRRSLIIRKDRHGSDMSVPRTILIIRGSPFSPMAQQEKHGGRTRKPPGEILPEMLARALDKREDLILTFETDPETGAGHVYAMTGQFVSECMLRKLVGKAESQRDEGSALFRQLLPKQRPGS